MSTLARKCWRTLEPYHGFIYFAPEAAEHYERVGLHGRSQYFASRAASMGAVGPLVVQATFFNFEPHLVEAAMDGVWERVTPDEVLLARHSAVDEGLGRMLGSEILDSAEVVEALRLVRPAVDAAMVRPEGRPLFAGHARLPEPDMAHLALWWAITLLREFRGDGHIAALLDAELSGLEALLLHGASGEVSMDVLQSTRGWSDDAWTAGLDGLRSRGLVDADDRLTPDGAALRARVEERTDALAAPAWSALSDDEASRLRSLVRPWSKAISAAMLG